jgi:hypothetical protein
MKTMSKEEFINFWLGDPLHRINCPDREYFNNHYLALPCNRNQNYTGWAAVFNHPLLIKYHNKTSNF